MSINIEILEKFVLADNKKEVLKEVTPFTDQYYFLELIEEIRSEENLEKIEQKVQKFIDNKKFMVDMREFIKTKYWFKRFDQTKSKEEKEKLVEKINTLFLNVNFDHMRQIKVENDQFS